MPEISGLRRNCHAEALARLRVENPPLWGYCREVVLRSFLRFFTGFRPGFVNMVLGPCSRNPQNLPAKYHENIEIFPFSFPLILSKN